MDINATPHSLHQRRGIRARCKQTPVSQSEVMVTRHRITSILNIAISMDVFVITQGRAHGVSGQLYIIISKSWQCTRVSHALSHAPAQTYTDRLRPSPRHKNHAIHHNPICLLSYAIIRSSSLLSLCPSRGILVPVNFCSRHNPRQSSKVPLPPI